MSEEFIQDEAGSLGSAAATQRRHLRALARHVNRATAAQRASVDACSQLREMARELRDKRTKLDGQLRDFLSGGATPDRPEAVKLGDQIADLDVQIEELGTEIQETEARCEVLTSVSAPLREQLTKWMDATKIDASLIGLGSPGVNTDQVHVVDLNQIAMRAQTARGAS